MLSCNDDDELAVYSCPLLRGSRQVEKLGSGLFYHRFLLRNNENGGKSSKVQFNQVTVVGVLPHVTAERRHLLQVIQQDSDC